MEGSLHGLPASNLTPFILFPGCRDLWPGAAAGALYSLHRGPQPGIAPHLQTPKPSHLILLLPDPFVDPQEALRTRGFLELSAPALLPLLRSDKLCVDEAELVLAARSWARVGAVSGGYGDPAVGVRKEAWAQEPGKRVAGQVPRPSGLRAGVRRPCWSGLWPRWRPRWCGS